MKKLIAIAMLLAGSSAFGQGALGDIVGTVVDFKTQQNLYGVRAWVEEGDRKYGAVTDPDGRFRISGVPAGRYMVSFISQGDTMLRAIEANIPMDGFANIGTVKFTSSIQLLDVVNISAKGDMKLVYGSLPIKELTSEEIAQSPSKFDAKGLVLSMSSEARMSEDGELMFRGSRKGDMIFMLDGVKGNEMMNVPSCAIGRMMVYTGGIPAKYGDTLGGVVVMETKSYFDLYRAWEAEQLRLGNN